MIHKDNKWMKRLSLFLFFILLGMGMSFLVQAEKNMKKALIVVDPGFSKSSFNVAQAIAANLSQKGMDVKLEKVSQYNPSDLNGIDLLVLGGPTYMAQPSGGLKKLVARLDSNTNLQTLLFITGGSDCRGLAPLSEMVKSKGLTVVGECSVLVPKENAEIGNKISKLLENI
jgi:flavorubredoxin